MVAVEFRQGTLGSDGRGNTGRRWSQLRPGRERRAQMVTVEVREEDWAQMAAVEARQGTLDVAARG